MNYILINDKILKKSQAKISVEERLCRFGDGVFETCRIFDGKIYNFKNHLERLKSGLKALKITISQDEFLKLEKNCQKLIVKNQTKEGILRISLSRGIGSQGYLPTFEGAPLLIAEILPLRKIIAKKIILGVSKITKPSIKSMPVAAKLISNVSSILAKIEAQESEFFDVVMLNKDGFIAETSSANIFWVKNNVIFTPNKSCDILLGTTRAKLFELLKKNKDFKIKEVKAKISVLRNCDEIFLTNAVLGVVAVDEIVFSKKNKTLKKKISKQIAEILQEDYLNFLCKTE